MGITVATTRVACNTALGDQTITTDDLNGTPVAALFIGCRATVDGTASAHAALCYGAASSSSDMWVIANFSEDNLATSDTHRRAAIDECVMFIDGTGAVDGEATFKEFVGNGCTITWGDAPASAYFLTVVFFICDGGYADTVQFAAQDVEVNVTGVGFPFDLLLTGGICSGFADSVVNDSHIALGAVANLSGLPQYSYDQKSIDGQGTSALVARTLDDYGSLEINNAGAVNWEGEFGNITNDGFSVWSRTGTSSLDTVGFLALNFGGNVQYKVGSIDSPVANGDESVTDPGFKPQFVILGLTQMAAFDTAYTNANAGSIGISVFDADEAYCNSIQDEDNQGTTDTQSISNDQIIDFPQDSGAAGYTATFTKFTPSGWDWNFTAQMGAAHLWWYAAIETQVIEASVRYRTAYKSQDD